MRYSVETHNNQKSVIKIILLAICLICDIVSIVGIIGALSNKNYIQIVWFVLLFAIALAIQIAATFLTYKVTVEYDGNTVSIKKTYPLKTKLYFSAQKSEISLKSPTDIDINDKNTLRLCVNSCPYPIYMIELSGKKYLVNLDDYMYSILEVKE